MLTKWNLLSSISFQLYLCLITRKKCFLSNSVFISCLNPYFDALWKHTMITLIHDYRWRDSMRLLVTSLVHAELFQSFMWIFETIKIKKLLRACLHWYDRLQFKPHKLHEVLTVQLSFMLQICEYISNPMNFRIR